MNIIEVGFKSIIGRTKTLIRNYRRKKIWEKYKNETRYHFLENPNISIGEFTYGIPQLKFYNSIKLSIGKYCSIADNVTVMGGGIHHLKTFSTYPFHFAHPEIFTIKPTLPDPELKETIIGNDVWIGHGATIQSGVKIGDGAVIGTNAVVSKDIPPYAIAIGCPIKILRYRFDEKTVDKLLELKWWDLNPKAINKLLPYLDNIDHFIKELELVKSQNKDE